MKSEQSRQKTKGSHRIQCDFHKRGVSRSNTNPSASSVRFSNPHPHPWSTSGGPSSPTGEPESLASAVRSAPIPQAGRLPRPSAPGSNFVTSPTWASFRLTLRPGPGSQCAAVCPNHIAIPRGEGVGRGLSSCGARGAHRPPRPREPLSAPAGVPSSSRSYDGNQLPLLGNPRACRPLGFPRFSLNERGVEITAFSPFELKQENTEKEGNLKRQNAAVYLRSTSNSCQAVSNTVNTYSQGPWRPVQPPMLFTGGRDHSRQGATASSHRPRPGCDRGDHSRSAPGSRTPRTQTETWMELATV